jgi:lipopolysaccharide export system permease protein
MDLLARGVSWRSLLAVFLCGMPMAVSFSVPVAVLMGCLLVFGRFSSDGEITAMRASGMNMWQIILPVLLVSAPLAAACLYVNNNLTPNGLYRQRIIVRQLGMDNPVQLLEEGRFINDFDGLSVYIGAKKGSNIRDVRIYDTRNPEVRREILAEKGTIGTNETGDVVIQLYKVRVDPLYEGAAGPGLIDSWSIRIATDPKSGDMEKRRMYMTSAEISDIARRLPELYPKIPRMEVKRLRMSGRVENNKRVVLALACVAFVLLGAPLGVTAHRKESSIGVAIGLFLVFNFYLFIIIAESLAKSLLLRPDLIVWLPIAISAGLGWRLVHRVR